MEKRGILGRIHNESDVAASLLDFNIALIVSVSLNIYQSFDASNSGSGENPSSNSSASEEMNFTFTRGPDSQKIVQGEFCLKVGIGQRGGNLSMVITAHDDDYEERHYVGLVFDTNQNGQIDTHDRSIALYANNMTQPSFLVDHGFLCFVETWPTPGPQKVTFNPDKGYTFTVQIPSEREPLNLPLFLKKDWNNPLHLCFYDNPWAKVFVRSPILHSRTNMTDVPRIDQKTLISLYYLNVLLLRAKTEGLKDKALQKGIYMTH